MNRLVAPVMATLLAAAPLSASAYTFILSGGIYYGPRAAVNHFPLGSLNDFVETGFLTGYIAYQNNGPALPNIFAESVHGDRIIDGALSDGTKLSESIDNGFVITTNDPQNGVVHTLIAAIEGGPYGGQELIEPDAKGNLTIHVFAGFDSGNPADFASTDVHPTTGAVRIPLSLKTQRGLPGGHDFAGPFASGRVFIGRVGDFDQDGFMDGDLVLSQPSPFELKVGQGDPVYFNRPFFSDLPVTALDAGILTINGVVQNFGGPIHETVDAGQVDVTAGYLTDCTFRIDTALTNLRRALRETTSHSAKRKIEYSQVLLVYARSKLDAAVRELEVGRKSAVTTKVDGALRVLGLAQATLTPLSDRIPQ